MEGIMKWTGFNTKALSGFDLTGCDLWFKLMCWTLTTEFFVIMIKIKIIGIIHESRKQRLLKSSMDLWHLNNMEVILTFWAINYVDCVPFSCIDSFHIAHNRAK